MKKVLLMMISVLSLTSCSIGQMNVVDPSDNIVTKEYKLKPLPVLRP